MQTHLHKACGFVMARESGNGALDQLFWVLRFRFRVADSDTDKKGRAVFATTHIYPGILMDTSPVLILL